MAGRPSPTQMASAMTRQKTAYHYSIDQCDVCDKPALAEFREKRLLWLDWLNDDDVHAGAGPKSRPSRRRVVVAHPNPPWSDLTPNCSTRTTAPRLP
jgi:hypothetical protein